jgi:rod shape-determining protein MreC
MDSLLIRFRNLVVLLVVLLAQLLLLAYQVKTNQEVRLVRDWAMKAATPVARVIEGARSAMASAIDQYFFLVGVKEQNHVLSKEVARLRMENQFLKRELETADRAKVLLEFRAQNPSRTVAARVIGTGAGGNAKTIILDRGQDAGVQKGMAVITPEGIVGKVVAVYSNTSTALLVTDAGFAAGVVSQKNRVRGILKGTGRTTCMVDYIQNEQKVEMGEWFYTTGDDRVFPRGLPVGAVVTSQPGANFRNVIVAPSGLNSGLDEVLVVLEGVHQPVPGLADAAQGIALLPAPPDDQGEGSAVMAGPGTTGPATDADRLREYYRRVGEAQGHVFGEGPPGSKPPDFNLKPGAQGNRPIPPAAAPGGTSAPSSIVKPRPPAP